jgi:ubiquinone biosynthesis protein
MGISLKPERLSRYRDLAALLWRHGRSDLVKSAGLQDALHADDPVHREEAAADARDLAADLERMGPTFVKLGQLLSTRPDILPDAYLDALTRLQDRVAPEPWEVIRATVESELNAPIEAVFREFDPVPLAAASLGQVHRAVLPNGFAVAVKVQRPGVRERIAADLDALFDVADFLDKHTDWGRRHGTRRMLEEFQRSLAEEIDYRREANNLRKLAENLQEFERIVVPLPVLELTTERVLTMDFVRGRKVSKLAVLASSADGSALAEELFRAYLRQILVDGFFHADPHPGNVFLTDDGRVALLDLGMTARVGPDMQDELLKWVLAVSEGRGEDAARVAVRVGNKRDDFDERAFRRRLGELVLRVKTEDERAEIGRVVLEGARIAAECGIDTPRELMLLGKALLNLDHVSRTLDPTFDPNASVRRNAVVILEQRFLKSFSPGNLFSSALELKELVTTLPRRVNRILDHAARNELSLKVNAIDEERLIAGMHKIANRITVGLVLAALIVAAAMLARVPTTFTLMGYPGIAILLFLGAAGGGIALVLGIVLHDRKPTRPT